MTLSPTEADLGKTLTLTEAELDMLCELANIGAGHAGTALSQMTGMRVMIDVPSVRIGRLDEVAKTVDGDGSVVVLSARILGGLTGQTFFVLNGEDAATLAGTLLGRANAPSKPLETLEKSSLVEAGNVLAASFMNPLANWMGKVLLPSVPYISIGPPDGRHTRELIGPNAGQALFVETEFRCEDRRSPSPGASHVMKLRGLFLFAPDAQAMNTMFDAFLKPVQDRRAVIESQS